MNFIQVDLVNVPGTDETIVSSYVNVGNIQLVASRGNVTIIETAQGALETNQSVAEIIAKISGAQYGRI